MVRLILVPKLDVPCLKRIAADEVCRNLLPEQPVVTVFICQDGLQQNDRTTFQNEAALFEMLYQDFNKLNRRQTLLRLRGFSFDQSLNTLQEHWRYLWECDIFYMTGFSVGRSMSENLWKVFQNHAHLGHDERNQSSAVENIFRAIVSRVQYNQMLYMGACGGAMCAGKSLLHHSAPECDLFDFCMGVSIQYDAGMKPDSCDTQRINHNTFVITGGAGLAVHIENNIVDASSFQACLGTKWMKWCQQASAAHKRAVHEISHRCTGPWYHRSVGIWWLKLNGVVVWWV